MAGEIQIDVNALMAIAMEVVSSMFAMAFIYGPKIFAVILPAVMALLAMA